MNSNTKNKLYSLMLSIPIILLGTTTQAADQTDDWKSMPATACESNNNGLSFGNSNIGQSWGWVLANRITTAQCPMIRDHRSPRPANFRVSLYHSGSKTTNCRVHVRDREANVGTSFPLNVSGNGYVQGTIRLNTNYTWGHVHVACNLVSSTYMLSYALHEL